MTGIKAVKVSNREGSFEFLLNRNITIVRGDSGTGKTTLFEMIADYTRQGNKSGVTIISDAECVALIDMDWKNQLENISDSIVFIDEGAEYLTTKDFARIIKSTNNYYVIFTRENLHDLPYSVEEIYEIKGKKHHRFEKFYKSDNQHMYYRDRAGRKIEFEALLTEDSNSGFQFYQNYFKDKDIECYTSSSNSNIFNWLKDNKDKKLIVIADGAAFGSEMDRVLKLQSVVKFR